MTKPVSEHLKEIADLLLKESGYPYPKDSREPSMRAFAFGMAIGSIMKLRGEWKEKEDDADPD